MVHGWRNFALAIFVSESLLCKNIMRIVVIHHLFAMFSQLDTCL